MDHAVVTDIEGTTSSLAFVKEVLFPYAKTHLADYVARHRNAPEVRRELDAVRGQPDESDETAVATLLRWIDEDRKATPLKALQGLVWAEGFAAGVLKGQIHADAVRALRKWRAAGAALYVYSSGSVAAQKLLFGNSEAGDLTPLFTGYFDTTTGPKLEAASYAAIARAVGLGPGRILFLSDNPGELDAAQAAGLRTACLNRGEVAQPHQDRHLEFTSFDGIDPAALLAD